MKAVKSNSDPDWGAISSQEGLVSTGVCLNGFFVFHSCRVAPARGTDILPPPHVKRPDPAGGSKGKTVKTDSA